MTAWRPQLFRQHALNRGVDPSLIENAVAAGEAVIKVNLNLPPIFSLRHLAHLSGADYGHLRAIVSRSLEDPYEVFRIRKRSSYPGEKRYRIICVPQPGLMQVQKWITQNVLALGQPHFASVAFSKGNRLIDAAQPHCGCRWLIKLDIQRFFESINEISAFRVFQTFGYQRLVAFELARICTRLGSATRLREGRRWTTASKEYRIKAYVNKRIGHLPQGAPTSPMIANLAMREFDATVTALASARGLGYTRYADDIALSTREKGFGRGRAAAVIGEVYKEMERIGLSPNLSKARVSGPGSRRIVLGLTVDGPSPRLPREFKANLRQHLYYLNRRSVGPSRHARRIGFVSTIGLRNHLLGLLSYARQIEKDFGSDCLRQFEKINWPI